MVWAESNASAVVLYDATTGHTRTILKADSPTAALLPVRGGGNTVVVLEEPSVPNDANPTTSWKIVTVDIASGRTTLVRQSKRASRFDLVPSPEYDGRWIVWGEPEGDTPETTVLMSFDTQTGRTFTLGTGLPFAGPSVDNGIVYYRRERPNVADIWRIPADGSAPAVQVTHTGVVGGVAYRNGGITWNQPPLGDLRSVWYMADGATAPTEVATVGDQAFPGHGFVVYAGRDYATLLASPIGHTGTEPLVVTSTLPSQGARWSVDGDVVVWAEEHATGGSLSSVIHVNRIDA